MTTPAPNPLLTPGRVLTALWRERLRVALVVLGFVALGVVVALTRPLQYVAEARIMPEMNSGSSDVFRRLASVAGFTGLDLADMEDVEAVRPDLYPNVLQSTPFVLFLSGQPVITQAGERLTVATYLNRQPGGFSPLGWLRREPARPQRSEQRAGQPLRLNDEQQALADAIHERVAARMDSRSGIITISANLPDPNVAAMVAQHSMDYLTRYVTGYRTEKARNDLLFYSQRLREAKQRYQQAQLNVFQYNDRHRYMVVQAATLEKQRLEAELSIAQTVYTELARQYEQARLKVQQQTPVFKVLEPATVPLRRSAPKRTQIVMIFAGLGLAAGGAWAIARQTDVVAQTRQWLTT